MTHRPTPVAAAVVSVLAALTVFLAPAPSTFASPAAAAAAHPVAPHVSVVPLAGVDPAVAGQVTALAPGAQAARLTAEGVDPLLVAPQIVSSSPSTARFDAIGITWSRADAPADVAVWVRTHEHAGWTPWELLGPVDTGPDAGTAEAAGARDRGATEPLLTDGADGFQVRIDASGALDDARAELVDAGRSAADGGAAEVPAPAPPASSGLPSGTPPRPNVISRAQWGADESLRGGPPDYTSPTKVAVVHHTVTSNSYSPTSAYAEIRAIYAYHTLSLGYNDIAYNALVDQYGQIYEGRYGGLENPVLSAATAAFNTSTFSVSVLGSFDVAEPSLPMLESISQIIAWKLAISYVDPLGESQLRSAGYPGSPHPEGEIVTFPDIIGHRDAFPTACPGQYLYDDLDAIRARVAQLTPAGLVHPVADVTPRTPGVNGSVHITSGLLHEGGWTVTILRSDGSVVAAYTGGGDALDVTWPMTDGGLPAANGTYMVRVGSDQNGTSALDFDQSITTAWVMLSVDSFSLTPSGYLASGWAASSEGGTAGVTIGSDADPFVTVTANAPRPDVAAAYPTLGPNRGFTVFVPVSSGVHRVCAGGVAPGLPSRVPWCSNIDSPSLEPIGNVESIVPEYGGVQISGWSFDRNSAASITVRAYVGTPTGTSIAGDYSANRARPDVGAAFPAYGPNHGFKADVNTGPGDHWSCINGLNVGAGSGDGNLACAMLSPVTGPPIGSLDALSAGAAIGWSFDPDTTAPINVHLYIDGAYRGAYAAGGARPDLAGPFPFMGTAHGYTIPLPALGPGRHTVCVYGISVGTLTVNPLLGCRTTP